MKLEVMVSSTATSIFLLLSFMCFISLPIAFTASPKVSAVFAFGDSTIDAGNNNYIRTIFHSNHWPYGQDLPSHTPTGRFSNGKLATDYFAESLGLKELLPAYLDPTLSDDDLLTGASFGSGGSGLDSEHPFSHKVMELSTQFALFEDALTRMRKHVGDEKIKEIVENAVFVISTGTNDMVNNAFSLGVNFRYDSLSNYQDFLLQNLESIVERLYRVGGRKFLVTGMPPIGCLPMVVTLNSIVPNPHWLERVCNDQLNRDCQNYNNKLHSNVIPQLQTKLQGSKIAYFDIYTPIMDMVINQAKYGFDDSLEGCCGTGMFEAGPLCNAVAHVCRDPSKYLFWDSMHLTQAGYSILADIGQKNVLPQLIN